MSRFAPDYPSDAGITTCPKKPQHATEPSTLTTQVCRSPALTEVMRP